MDCDLLVDDLVQFSSRVVLESVKCVVPFESVVVVKREHGLASTGILQRRLEFSSPS
jgi:hypothetical protein